MTRPTTRTRAALAALALCAGSCVPIMPALGAVQPASPFDSIELGVAPAEGVLTLEAAAAWAWKRGTTHRVVLDREVRVRLGSSSIVATRADLWIRPLEGAPDRYQVFGVFADMRQIGGAAQVEGELVPVRGVIDLAAPIRLETDARFTEPPTTERMTDFLRRTERIFNERLMGAGDRRAGAGAERDQPLRWPARPYDPAPDRGARETARALPEDYEKPAPRIEPAPIARDEPEAAPAREDDDRAAAAPGDGPPAALPAAPPTVPEREPIFTPSGIFSLAIDGGVVVRGARDGEPATITIDGGLTLQYQDPARRQTMDLRARRAVIFLREGAAPGATPSTLGASEVGGIYLEGGVFAANPEWSVRTPTMYIDLERDRMLMLDAVFWTIDQERDMPIYLRAQEVRRTSIDEFRADKTTVAASAFHRPDLNVGVRRIKVTVDPGSRSGGPAGAAGDGGFGGGPGDPRTGGNDAMRRVLIEGRNVTLRYGSIPFLWFPIVRSDGQPIPLRAVRVGDSDRSGFAVRTEWDLFSLLGIDPRPGVDADLLLDYYAERGPALGVAAGWDTDTHRGSLFGYLLPEDNGTDVLVSGREISREGETRGMISVEDIWRLQDPWTLAVKGNYISDEAFIPAFEEQRGREALDFDSRVRLERTDDRTQFSLELSGSPHDFLSAEHRLVAPGFAVDKIPEASLTTMPVQILEGVVPFDLTHQSETNIGAMRLRLSEVTAADYGFDTVSLAMRAFGTAPGVSLASVQRAAGLDEGAVARFDTRHEFRAEFDAGPIKITPAAVGRLTAYDSDFPAFTPAQGDETRLWGAASVTFSTELSKVDNDASSELLDIHRIRHVIEPSLTLWAADSNYAPTDTPIYDDDIEGLTRGTKIIAAIDQTWQTKRGSVGRWRDADLLRIRTEMAWADRRAGTSVIPETLYARPELSNPGDYAAIEAIFTPTDALGFAGEYIYDHDADTMARTSAGVLVNQGGSLSGSVEYRDINAFNAKFLASSARLRVSEKYSASTSVSYNFDENDFQNLNAGLERRFQSGTLGITVSFNNIRDDTSLGIYFRLNGTTGSTGFGRGGDFLNERRR